MNAQIAIVDYSKFAELSQLAQRILFHEEELEVEIDDPGKVGDLQKIQSELEASIRHYLRLAEQQICLRFRSEFLRAYRNKDKSALAEDADTYIQQKLAEVRSCIEEFKQCLQNSDARECCALSRQIRCGLICVWISGALQLNEGKEIYDESIKLFIKATSIEFERDSIDPRFIENIDIRRKDLEALRTKVFGRAPVIQTADEVRNRLSETRSSIHAAIDEDRLEIIALDQRFATLEQKVDALEQACQGLATRFQ